LVIIIGLILTSRPATAQRALIWKTEKIRSLLRYSLFMTWRQEILEIVRKLPEKFTLQDMYAYNPQLKRKFPKNNNIEAKIRQQLQYLRDDGLIQFVDDRGTYRKRKL